MDLTMHFVELLLAVGKQQEVVHVARIGAGAEIADDHVVHGIEIDVGEELRGLVAEGQAAAALERSEKGIAGEIVERFLLRVGTRNDEFDEAEGIGTVDRAGEEDPTRTARKRAGRGRGLCEFQSRCGRRTSRE